MNDEDSAGGKRLAPRLVSTADDRGTRQRGHGSDPRVSTSAESRAVSDSTPDQKSKKPEKKQKGENPETDTRPPGMWMMLVLGLVGSVAFNFFLIVNNRGTLQRYQSLLVELRGGRGRDRSSEEFLAPSSVAAP